MTTKCPRLKPLILAAVIMGLKAHASTETKARYISWAGSIPPRKSKRNPKVIKIFFVGSRLYRKL